MADLDHGLGGHGGRQAETEDGAHESTSLHCYLPKDHVQSVVAASWRTHRPGSSGAGGRCDGFARSVRPLGTLGRH
jgi:hypothetical protein